MGLSQPSHNDKRRFERHDLSIPLECQYVFDSKVSDAYVVHSQNISQAGLLVQSSVPIPLGATISFAVDKRALSGKVDILKLQSYIEIDIEDKVFVRLYGKVVRIQSSKKGEHLIAIHLINK